MKEEKQPESTHTPRVMTTEVGAKAARKLHARRRPEQKVWFGLGMMGLIGWSVAVPTLLGAGLGVYCDTYYPGERSWTLAFLVAGLAIGCFNAWHWVSKEEKAIHVSENEVSATDASSAKRIHTKEPLALKKEANKEKKTSKN